MDPDDLSELIGGLYDAAGGAIAWEAALARLTAALGCAGVFLFAVDRRSGARIEAVHGMDPRSLVEYAERLDIDPRLALAQRRPEQSVFWDYQAVAEREIDRHPFYDWLRGHGYRYFLGGRVFDSAESEGFIAFQRSAAQGHVADADIERFGLLLPHLRRALQLQRRLGALGNRVQSIEEVMERCAYGVLLLDGGGRVMFANGAARAVLTAGRVLRAGADGLRAVRPSDDRRLKRLIQGAMAGEANPVMGAGGAMTLPRSDGAPPYSVLVAPLPRGCMLFALDRPGVVVFLSDPAAVPALPAERLRALWGLTAAETAVAQALAAGATVAEAAAILGMAQRTARVHLASIFRKTGAHRQADLVRLLLTSVAGLGAPAI